MTLRKNNCNLPLLSPEQRASNGTLRPGGSTVATPGKAGYAALRSVALVSGYSKPGGGTVGYIIDATASRSATWKLAQETQARMFETINGLHLKLVHFGGNRITAHEWKADKDKVAGIMRKVSCEGGQTQIIEGLEVFLKEDSRKPDSIIVVGDSFEESSEELVAVAHKLADRSIKVFPFQEDACTRTEENFRKLASITGGVYAKFDANMPLQDLCEGVAFMASGGFQALQKLRNKEVLELFRLQLNRLQLNR